MLGEWGYHGSCFFPMVTPARSPSCYWEWRRVAKEGASTSPGLIVSCLWSPFQRRSCCCPTSVSTGKTDKSKRNHQMKCLLSSSQHALLENLHSLIRLFPPLLNSHRPLAQTATNTSVWWVKSKQAFVVLDSEGCKSWPLPFSTYKTSPLFSNVRQDVGNNALMLSESQIILTHTLTKFVDQPVEMLIVLAEYGWCTCCDVVSMVQCNGNSLKASEGMFRYVMGHSCHGEFYSSKNNSGRTIHINFKRQPNYCIF